MTICAVLPLFLVLTSAQPIASQTSQAIVGTYVGVVKTTAPDGSPDEDPGVIVIKDEAGKLTVSAGPNLEQLMVGTNIERKGDRVLFQVTTGGDVPRVIKFEVTVAGSQLTGQASMEREDRTLHAVLEFARQP